MATFSTKIAAGSDDANVFDDGSGYTETGDGANRVPVVRHATASSRQNAGLRFQNVTVPAGSTIVSAQINCNVQSTTEDDPSLNIFGVDEDDPATFNGTSRRPYPGDLTFTTASTTWHEFGVGTGYVNAGTGDDVTDIVAELVARGGWASGNAMAFVFEASDSAGDDTRDVRWQSFENDSANAAQLVIEYTAPTTNIERTATPVAVNLQTVDHERTATPVALNAQTENERTATPVAMNVEAPELMTNGGFEENTDGWAAVGGGTIARTTDEAFEGSASLQVDTDGSTTFDGTQFAVTLNNGVDYVARARVLAPEGANLRLRIAGTTTTFSGNGEWQEVTVEATGAGTATNLDVINNGGGQVHTFYVDDVELFAGAEHSRTASPVALNLQQLGIERSATPVGINVEVPNRERTASPVAMNVALPRVEVGRRPRAGHGEVSR